MNITLEKVKSDWDNVADPDEICPDPNPIFHVVQILTDTHFLLNISVKLGNLFFFIKEHSLSLMDFCTLFGRLQIIILLNTLTFG
jgi:hypothetical protein